MAKTQATRKRHAGSAQRVAAALPTVSAAKVLEARSRPIFTEAVAPWLVTGWTDHDYGIDAIVEVTRVRPNQENLDATSKRFAAQLKATEEEFPASGHATVRARPEQIRYWIESTEPVILALCHVPTRKILWRWLDEGLIEELTGRDPAWIGQETVGIPLSADQVLDARALSDIEARVVSFRRGARRVLAPGTYHRLQTVVSQTAALLALSAKKAGFESVAGRLRDLERALRGSTYVVALTGPPRAGKSTLLNALLGREVSPVGRLPTTAVSIMVVASDRDEAEVVFEDGSHTSCAATATFLDEYATQEKNPDNEKRVKLIVVRLVNELLERGVAYADAPGLHDPNATIRGVTERALQAAHAVLYILDVSPARDGGFALTNFHIDDLARLRSMADRLFVVLNKADVLTADQRREVAAYVEATLRKYSIWDALPEAPIFVSAREAWGWRTTGSSGDAPHRFLDEALWKHLLRNSATGMNRLATALTELHRAGGDLVALLAARRLGGAKALGLRESLDACRTRGQDLVAACRQRAKSDIAVARERVAGYSEAVLQDLRRRLEGVSLNQPLPGSAEIEKTLQGQLVQLFANLWREMTARFQNFATFIGQEVEKSLRQARLATGPSDGVHFLVPQLPGLDLSASDTFEEAWTGLFTGGLFGLLLGSPWAWGLAAGGLLVGLILGKERRRRRQIGRILERARSSIESVFQSLFAQLHEKIHLYAGNLERHVTDRISVFVDDVERQLERLGSPLSPEEQKQLEATESEVQDTLDSLRTACRELNPGPGAQ